MGRPRPDAADLAWLVEVLWGKSAEIGATPARVDAGSTYLVAPNRERPRMLLPEDPASARAALRAGTGTRSAHAGRRRATLAWVLGTDIAWRIVRDRVWVRGPDPLREGLEGVLGGPVVVAAGMRVRGPFRKPVVQVLAPGGEVLAYAKVAWNEVTATNVRAEHEALRAFAGVQDAPVRTPEAMAVLEHRGFPVLVTRPMPERLKRYRPADGPPPGAVSREISEILGAVRSPVAIEQRLRSRLDAIRASDNLSAAWVAPVVAEAAAVRDGLDTAALDAGAWHGDWAAWNLGREAGALWAWDWEHWRPGVPVGLDVPHFEFQQRFVAERTPLAEAFAAARVGSAQALASLGYDEAARRTIHAVHVLEVCLRYLEAELYGVPANPRFVVGALEALRAVRP